MRQELTQLLDTYDTHIHGQSKNLRLLLTAILSDGHVLLEGVPGTGKTQMVRTLADLISGDFKRIQFTPDLLPSDITGNMIYNMKNNDFQTMKGPIFSHLVLADEINRTPAKTQAALLEAMGEQQVTIQNETYSLPDVFFVAATQNPIEFEGTYPLPEAQQDRFLFKLLIDFPEFAEEMAVVQQVIEQASTHVEPTSVMSLDVFRAIKEDVGQMTINEDIIQYITEIVRRTRTSDNVQHGASTRAAIAISKAAKAWAYLSERDYVTPDDVKVVTPPALRHRIQLSPHSELEGMTTDAIISEIVGQVTVPR